GFPSLDPRLGMKCSILVRLPPPHEISPVVLKSPKTRSRSLGSQKTAREEMPKPFSPYIENPFMKLVSKLDSPFPIPVNRGGVTPAPHYALSPCHLLSEEGSNGLPPVRLFRARRRTTLGVFKGGQGHERIAERPRFSGMDLGQTSPSHDALQFFGSERFEYGKRAIVADCSR